MFIDYTVPMKSIQDPEDILSPSSSPTSTASTASLIPDPNNISAQTLRDHLQNHFPIDPLLAQLDYQLDLQTLHMHLFEAGAHLERNKAFPAKKAIDEALVIAEKYDDEKLLARCQFWLAKIEWFNGRENAAYRIFRKVRDVLDGEVEEEAVELYVEFLKPGRDVEERRERMIEEGFMVPFGWRVLERVVERVVEKIVVKCCCGVSECRHIKDMEERENTSRGVKRKMEDVAPSVSLVLRTRLPPRKDVCLTVEDQDQDDDEKEKRDKDKDKDKDKESKDREDKDMKEKEEKEEDNPFTFIPNPDSKPTPYPNPQDPPKVWLLEQHDECKAPSDTILSKSHRPRYNVPDKYICQILAPKTSHFHPEQTDFTFSMYPKGLAPRTRKTEIFSEQLWEPLLPPEQWEELHDMLKDEDMTMRALEQERKEMKWWWERWWKSVEK